MSETMEHVLDTKRGEDQRHQHLLVDVLLDRTVDFSMGEQSYHIYPLTLAKMLTLEPHIKNLSINREALVANPFLESLRLAKEQRKLCCHILSWHCTPNSRSAFHDDSSVEALRKVFQEDLNDSDLAAMMLCALTSDKTESLMSYLGLDEERERMLRVMEIRKRKSSGNISFAGLSLFGSFIGPLKEMGYTDDEIIYEKGYSYLRLMLADKMTSVFLSDEERSELYTELGGTLLSGDDPDSAELLGAFFADRGIKIS